MAKLSDIFPEETGTATVDQRIESLERRISLLEEITRQLYQSGDQKLFVAPTSAPQKRSRRKSDTKPNME